MSMDIKIEGMDDLLKELREFPKELARASRNAENTTATAVNGEGFRIASEEYNITQARLKKDSRGRATSYVKRSSPGSPGAVVTFKGGDGPKAGDRPGLQHFKTDRQERNKTQRGWKPSYQVKRDGSVKQVERGFYGEGKLKGQGIFQRRDDSSRKIVRQTGPSIKQMVESSEVYDQLRGRAETLLMQKMVEAVNKQLAKVGRK
ncbi:hypothetical protein ANRL2_02435 [Anaerolineae bacterium]|nr:hypothetical protein ANRL2_02435 [Anaerolineae bacterium]